MTEHQIPAFTPPAAGDLPTVEVAGRKFAVAIDGGQVYAFDDAYTYAQCSLSGGEVEDGAVIAPATSQRSRSAPARSAPDRPRTRCGATARSSPAAR